MSEAFNLSRHISSRLLFCVCSEIHLFGWQAVKCQGLDLDSLLPDQEMLMKIMVHPLQIQVLVDLVPYMLVYVCCHISIELTSRLSLGVSVRDP